MTTQTQNPLNNKEIVRLSIIVPAYNEEENVLPLTEEIIAALDGLSGGFELILVDDAST
ncbi:MAG: glycosyltransferase, partial [Azoarcus sp.]|nr:glycosyltransferase [Azoarcus sp.]